MSDSHDFSCPDCLICCRCGMHMSEAMDGRPLCRDRVRRHPHPLPEHAQIPYVPEWAVPLESRG